MKIKSLELIHLKSYDHSTIELSRNINLLVGANNSGKSTLIKALLNLQYPIFSRSDIRSTFGDAKTIIEIIEVADDDHKMFYNAKEPKQHRISNKYTVLWGIGIPPANVEQQQHLYFDTNLSHKRLANHTFQHLHPVSEVNFLKEFPRFSNNERNNYIYPFLSKRKTDHYDLNIKQQETFEVTDSLRTLAAKLQKISNPSHTKYGEFIRLCNDILGFTIGVISSEHGSLPGIYTTETEMVPISNMGDGVANIVGFIILLLTEDNKLYLVEELENDIHPKALKKLLELIISKSKENQFVISTHSHIVVKYLGAVPDSKIFYIDWHPSFFKDEKEYRIPTSQVSEVENSPANRIGVLEKLGYEFFDFELHESYLILEESSAERIIRDFLIPHFTPGLYNRIKTIAAKGVSDLEPRVHDFNRLFVFIHTSPAYYKKAWVIADGDTPGKECIDKLKENFKDWTDHLLNFSQGAFEYYFPKRFQEEVKEVLAIADKKEKRQAKKELLDSVLMWVIENSEVAIAEFGTSAKEVIDILKEIEKEVTKKK